MIISLAEVPSGRADRHRKRTAVVAYIKRTIIADDIKHLDRVVITRELDRERDVVICREDILPDVVSEALSWS